MSTENLPNVSVVWDGEANRVAVSLADRWTLTCATCGRAVTGRATSEYVVTGPGLAPTTLMAADPGWAIYYATTMRPWEGAYATLRAEPTGRRVSTWDVHADDGTYLCH